VNSLLRGFCRCPDSNIVAALFVLGLIFMKEFLEERLRLVRSLAQKADPFTKTRLLELADSYEGRIGLTSKASRLLRQIDLSAAPSKP
jgi:hypothetical protein